MSKKHKSKKPIKKPNNFAYIDGANLDKGLKDLGWRLDYQRFRVWLKDKYSVSRAYIFIGLIPKYKDLYTYLQKSGFTLIELLIAMTIVTIVFTINSFPSSPFQLPQKIISQRPSHAKQLVWKDETSSR